MTSTYITVSVNLQECHDRQQSLLILPVGFTAIALCNIDALPKLLYILISHPARRKRLSQCQAVGSTVGLEFHWRLLRILERRSSSPRE